MAWKPEVQTDNTGQWYGNALRFETKAEAEAQVADLQDRWLLVHATRATECNDPVNYRYVDGKLVSVTPGKPDGEPVEMPTRTKLEG